MGRSLLDRSETTLTTTGKTRGRTALVALEQLPPKHRPQAHMDDIRKLLAAGCQPGTVTLHLAQAKCRLFPNIDPLTIYEEYGLGDGQG